jgi:hypothetical protein
MLALMFLGIIQSFDGFYRAVLWLVEDYIYK